MAQKLKLSRYQGPSGRYLIRVQGVIVMEYYTVSSVRRYVDRLERGIEIPGTCIPRRDIEVFEKKSIKKLL